MIKEQVELEVVATNFERHLTTDKREPRSEPQEEALDSCDQRRLDVALLVQVLTVGPLLRALGVGARPET